MKRTVLKRAFVLVLLALLLFACEDFWHPEDGGTGSTVNGNVNLAGTTWKLQSVLMDKGEPVTRTLNFVDGSKVKLVDVTASNTITINGTYTFNDNSGTINFSQHDPGYWSFVINGNTLFATMSNTTTTWTDKFIKQ